MWHTYPWFNVIWGPQPVSPVSEETKQFAWGAAAKAIPKSPLRNIVPATKTLSHLCNIDLAWAIYPNLVRQWPTGSSVWSWFYWHFQQQIRLKLFWLSTTPIVMRIYDCYSLWVWSDILFNLRSLIQIVPLSEFNRKPNQTMLWIDSQIDFSALANLFTSTELEASSSDSYSSTTCHPSLRLSAIFCLLCIICWAPPRGFREHGRNRGHSQIIFRKQGNSWLDCWDQGNTYLVSIIISSPMNRR